MSLNKVDKAMQAVGISIHDATGQFREFDDVIMELAERWNTIDNNTQRYIATVMAGNRLILLAVAWVAIITQIKTM
jgi:phage-related minor tail protein